MYNNNYLYFHHRLESIPQHEYLDISEAPWISITFILRVTTSPSLPILVGLLYLFVGQSGCVCRLIADELI